MSRIGKLPVAIPAGVTCKLDGQTITVTGPKGALSERIPASISVAVDAGELTVSRPSEKKEDRAFHGLTRALIQNMVNGVTQGFERNLVIEGVGYRVALQGKSLNLQLGYSHPVTFDPPAGIEFAVDGTQKIKIIGISKQQVGQVAADIRKIRKPEPYKGKGVRYEGEKIRRKVGKSGSK
ncbi:MAG: 50S ribosomal protein L6 [Candidatus Hydrogenedentes bacterium]|nr:50S ribosomal protein L6 [Candidatus Hydrogenedentota bacterium]